MTFSHIKLIFHVLIQDANLSISFCSITLSFIVLIDLYNNASSANSLKVLSKMYWTLSDFWINRYLIFLWRFSTSVPNCSWAGPGQIYEVHIDILIWLIWDQTTFDCQHLLCFFCGDSFEEFKRIIPPGLGCFIIRAEKLHSMTLNALLVIHGTIKNYVALLYS